GGGGGGWSGCGAGGSRWWRMGGRAAASPAWAGGWRKTMRRRQRFPPSSRGPHAICGRVSAKATAVAAGPEVRFAGLYSHRRSQRGAGSACRRRRGEQEFCAPPATQQQRRREHVADHGIVEKRQRRDVAMNETMQIMRIHAAERPDCKIRGREEDQGRRQDEGGEHDHGPPCASPHAQKRGERKRGIDDA